MGRSIVGAVIVAEEIATIYPVLAGAFVSPTLCGGKNISGLGGSDQKKKYLPGLARGSLLFTYGLAEPGAVFSGLSSIRTTALKDGGKFILNGAKTFVRLDDEGFVEFIGELPRNAAGKVLKTRLRELIGRKT